MQVVKAMSIDVHLLNSKFADVASSCCILHPLCEMVIERVARQLDYPFSSSDIVQNYPRFEVTYVRNVLRRMEKEHKIVFHYRSINTYYILPEWKQRFPHSSIKTNPMGERTQHQSCNTLNFDSLIESLDWGELCVHDIRLESTARDFRFVEINKDWDFNKHTHCYQLHVSCDGYGFTIMCYDTGKIQIAISCTLQPIECTMAGLVKLTALAGQARGYLGESIPAVEEWIVTQWHYGRDSVKEVSGYSFNVTFNTWSDNLARFYAKHELGKIRMEVIQSPKKKLADLLEEKLFDEREEGSYLYQSYATRYN